MPIKIGREVQILKDSLFILKTYSRDMLGYIDYQDRSIIGIKLVMDIGFATFCN